jgi:hypothetical protein
MRLMMQLKQTADRVDDNLSLVEDNGGLDGTLVLHGLQALSPLLKLESLVDNSLDLDLARVQIVDRGS